MADLVAVPAEGSQRFVDRLRSTWDDGDAVLPVDPRLPEPARRTLLDAMAPARVLDADGRVAEARDAPALDDGDALVVATSGSTGTPKGAVLTHAGLEASVQAVDDALAVDPATDVWLCCLPLAHVAGLAVVVRALTAGTPLVVHDGFDVAAVADAPAAGCTLTSLVPTALARVDVSGFRHVIVGGSAPPAHRPDNVSVSYGLTETFGAVVLDGRPLGGVELRVVDGEVHVRGPMVLRAYRDGQPAADDDGWFATGDAGEWADDGRLVVRGRRGDLIITGGQNVWPAPVEAALAGHPAVAEVAVVGRADPEWGEVVTALVVPADPATPPSLQQLRDWAKARLAPYAAPRRLELVPSLPRTSLGKVRRHALKPGDEIAPGR